VATPLPSVVTVVEPEKDPLAPLTGAENVTETPLMLTPDSCTLALNAVLKAVLMSAVWGVPASAQR
jgi:hypothetical protein